ncbi:hypothetical protein GE09DRAFT_1285685 [Coniochaeta sp. 2T2.1]|nr:hypothetical protein GE09DRAFT_1285685 [Coniochaeta sp. 2T2.1]
MLIPTKRSADSEDSPRKKPKTTGIAADLVAAIDRLSIKALPPGAMRLGKKAVAILRSAIDHARRTARSARTLPNNLAAIADKANGIAQTYKQWTNDADFEGDREADALKDARTSLGALQDYFSSEDDAARDLDSISAQLAHICRSVQAARQAEEECKRRRLEHTRTVDSIKALIVKGAGAYRDVAGEKARLLQDMDSMKGDAEYMAAKARTADEFARRLLELLTCAGAAPAAEVLDQVLESVLQELEQQLGAAAAEAEGRSDTERGGI